MLAMYRIKSTSDHNKTVFPVDSECKSCIEGQLKSVVGANQSVENVGNKRPSNLIERLWRQNVRNKTRYLLSQRYSIYNELS